MSGRVGLFAETPEAVSVHIADRGEGEVIGELALLDGGRRSTSALTVSECNIASLSRTDFLHCLDRSPAMGRSIIETLVARLRETTEATAGARSMDLLGRLSFALLDLTKTSQSNEITITQQELADRVGAARESVNKELAKLEMLGAIERGRCKVVIHRRRVLEKRVQGL